MPIESPAIAPGSEPPLTASFYVPASEPTIRLRRTMKHDDCKLVSMLYPTQAIAKLGARQLKGLTARLLPFRDGLAGRHVEGPDTQMLCGAWTGFAAHLTRLIDCGHYFDRLGLMDHMPGAGKAMKSALTDLAMKPSRLLDVNYAIALPGENDNRHL